jgi:hypothetical protein
MNRNRKREQKGWWFKSHLQHLLVYGWGSTEGVTDLQRAKLVYKGGDSSTEGKTHQRIGRLVYGGGDFG